MNGDYRVLRTEKILGRERKIDELLSADDLSGISPAVIAAMESQGLIERVGGVSEKLSHIEAQNERIMGQNERILEALGAAPKARKAKKGA